MNCVMNTLRNFAIKAIQKSTINLDAKNLDDLAVLLREHLGTILKGLNDRID